ARDHADDGDGNRIRRHLAAALDEEVVVLTLADVDAAAARADHDAGIRFADRQPGVGPRFTRGDDADERRARVALRIRAVSRIPQTVAPGRRHAVDRHRRHGRGDAAAQIGRIELADRARAAAAAADAFPEALAAHAERRDDADARNHDAGMHGAVHARSILMSTVSRIIAWIGGGAFVASLALCAWWYFISLSTLRPFSGTTALATDAALVSVFAMHHSLFARDWVKRRLSMIPASMIRSFYVWVASLLLAASILLWQPVG